ncbi:MAG: FMN-binding negative transcriptional regulator [Candidatus Thiodiazotropha sp. DIVDIV]
MYIPDHFKTSKNEEIFAFIEEYSFGQLISQVDGRPFSSHIPFLLSQDRTKIIGHLAKANPQHSEIDGQQVLITLQGPHGYISPSWCSSPGVPTWNYQAVHVYGECRLFQGTKELQQIVDSLTRKHEAAFENPWTPEYRASILQAIIGVEITIEEIQSKYKLSQNRSQHDQLQIIGQLRALGWHKLAEAMAQNVL